MNLEFANHVLSQHKASQQQALQGLAVEALQSGDSWLGFAAQLTSDWLALQFVVASAEEDLSPEELSELLTDIWTAVENHLNYEIFDATDFTVSLESAVTSIREIFSQKLNSHSWAYFTELVGPSSIFASTYISQDDLTNHFGWSYFGEGKLEQLINERFVRAKSLYTEYYTLKDSAISEAFSALYQADMAIFEAWLLDGAHRSHDSTRIWPATKLALASGYLHQLPGIPTSLEEYHANVRGALLLSAGAENASELLGVLPEILN